MTLDQDTLNSILLFFITAAGAVFSAVWLGLVMWTWRDMQLRSRDPLAQITASLMVAVLGIFGVLIYIMLRPQETLAEAYERSLEEEALLQNIEEKPVCPGCSRPVKENWQVCPYCHTKLKKPCINCGEMLDLPWNLCPVCATSQVAGSASGARQSAGRSQPRPASMAPPQNALPQNPAPARQTETVEYIEDDVY